MCCMLAREYTGQKVGYLHNDVMEAQWSRIISRDLQYLRCFQSPHGYNSFSILIHFKNVTKKLWQSTQNKGNVWNKRKQGDL